MAKGRALGPATVTPPPTPGAIGCSRRTLGLFPVACSQRVVRPPCWAFPDLTVGYRCPTPGPLGRFCPTCPSPTTPVLRKLRNRADSAPGPDAGRLWAHSGSAFFPCFLRSLATDPPAVYFRSWTPLAMSLPALAALWTLPLHVPWSMLHAHVPCSGSNPRPLTPVLASPAVSHDAR